MRKAVLSLLLITTLASAWSCKPYAKLYRKYTNLYLGINYPYQFLVAQGAVESHCSLRAISNDSVGSQGIGQITWRWWKDYLTDREIPDLYTVENQIKAQVLVLKKGYADLLTRDAYKKCGKQHWIPFQIYNGGTLVFKEIDRADSCIHDEVRVHCRRKTVYFNNGSSRNACNINYEYPNKILDFATRYYGYVPYVNSDWRMFKDTYNLWDYDITGEINESK